LRKGHAEKLVPTRKFLQFEIAFVTLNATLKSLERKKLHQLCKDRFARIHQSSAVAKIAKASAGLVFISNRSLGSKDLNFSVSTTYRQWSKKRWDSSDLSFVIFGPAEPQSSA
jgi:hypothetical protein